MNTHTHIHTLDKQATQANQTHRQIDKETNRHIGQHRFVRQLANQTKQTNRQDGQTLINQTNHQIDKTDKQTKQTNRQIGQMDKSTKQTHRHIDTIDTQTKQIDQGNFQILKTALQTNRQIDKSDKLDKQPNQTNRQIDNMQIDKADKQTHGQNSQKIS